MRKPPPPPPSAQSAVPSKPQIPPVRIIREGDVTVGQIVVAGLFFVFLLAVGIAVDPRGGHVEPVPCAPTVRTCTRTDVGPVGAPYLIVECVEE